MGYLSTLLSLQWRHNGRDGVPNHRRPYCLLRRLFRRRSKKTSKLRVTGFCEGDSSVTGGFPSQRASNAKMFPSDDITMCTQILPNLVRPLHPPHWSNRFEILHREQENNWAMGKNLMAKRDFARFEFKMSFRVIPYIAITTWGWHASIAWCETAVAPMCRPKQWSYCSLAL